jgi:spermidine synthase
MKPWETLAKAKTPDGFELVLRKHDSEYTIFADGYDLMVSRMHGSEEALATLAIGEGKPAATVLVGGLGMGYTLRAALEAVSDQGRVVVAELIPEVVEWNRGPLGPLAGNPLDDPRASVEVADVAQVIRESDHRFDAILLDVDNGPDAFVQRANAWLYGFAGLGAIRRALRPKGVLAVWSVSGTGESFERDLRRAGFEPERKRVRARGRAGGPWQIVFLGRT